MIRRFFHRMWLLFDALVDVLDGIEDLAWLLLAAVVLLGLPMFFFWRAFHFQHWWMLSAITLAMVIFGYAYST